MLVYATLSRNTYPIGYVRHLFDARTNRQCAFACLQNRSDRRKMLVRISTASRGLSIRGDRNLRRNDCFGQTIAGQIRPRESAMQNPVVALFHEQRLRAQREAHLQTTAHTPNNRAHAVNSAELTACDLRPISLEIGNYFSEVWWPWLAAYTKIILRPPNTNIHHYGRSLNSA